MQAKVVVVVDTVRFDVMFDPLSILEVVAGVTLTPLVPFEVFSSKVLAGDKRLCCATSSFPAHQHNRYSPPAALTTLVPHVTAAPLS
jgi:hypothetical protein